MASRKKADVKCRDCKWYHRPDRGIRTADGADVGTCRKHAPRATLGRIGGANDTLWPAVESWLPLCGEGEAA